MLDAFLLNELHLMTPLSGEYAIVDTLEVVQTMNIEKLSKRHTKGFNPLYDVTI